MSKKDTVIIAILLNAGLLIVLFATSLKSDQDEGSPQMVNVEVPNIQKEEVVALPTTQAQVLEIPKASAPLTGDEVDQMIRQYTPPAIASAPVDIKPNFVEDLQALAGAASSQESTAPTETSSYKEVKVKKGDVLEKIARINHVTVDEIMNANQMTSTRLKIGQVLKIPAKVKKETTVASSAPSQDGAIKYYTMKNGDNLWAIAVKNQMKMEDLLKLNNLTDEKARKLKAGDQIRIK